MDGKRELYSQIRNNFRENKFIYDNYCNINQFDGKIQDVSFISI